MPGGLHARLCHPFLVRVCKVDYSAEGTMPLYDRLTVYSLEDRLTPCL